MLQMYVFPHLHFVDSSCALTAHVSNRKQWVTFISSHLETDCGMKNQTTDGQMLTFPCRSSQTISYTVRNMHEHIIMKELDICYCKNESDTVRGYKQITQ